MLLQQAATSCLDFLQHLGALIFDPISSGEDVSHGDGEPVLLIPGFLAGDLTMLPMARWLSRIGYHPYLSGIDWNVGCPNRKAEHLTWRLEQMMRETGRAAAVVGHSLGGLLARFLGSMFPDGVSHVIALGSPIQNSFAAIHPQLQPTMRVLQSFWQLLGTPLACGSSACSCGFGRVVSAPIPAKKKFTSIFSRDDEVVDWHACMDRHGENVEVSGGHASLIVNPEVYRIIARLLDGHRPGAMRRFANGASAQ